MKRMLWLPLLMLFLAGTTYAKQQTVSITGTSPEDGAVGVALETTVSFTFDQPADPARFSEIFDVNPSDSVDVDLEAGIVSDDGLTVTFNVVQRPETDYTWFVFGSNYHDSVSGMPFYVAPHVLRYTTAASGAVGSVSGTVSFAAGKQSGLATAWQRPDRLAPVRAFSPNGEIVTNALPAKQDKSEIRRLVKSMQAKTSARISEIGGTVVVLTNCNIFDCPDDVNRGDGDLLAGTVITDPAGSYTISNIRDGQYYVFAAQFGPRGDNFDDDTSIPDFLGFYDMDGDGVPDPIDVAGGDVTGIDANIFPISAFGSTAGEVADVAKANADLFAADQALVTIFGAPIAEDGTTANAWLFFYYSELNQTVTISAVGLFDEFAFAGTIDATEDIPAPLPDVYVDSDVAVGAALAGAGGDFMAAHPDADIAMMAGDPTQAEGAGPVIFDTLPGDAYWFVIMNDATALEPAFHITLVDMATGDAVASLGTDSAVTGLSLLAAAQTLVDGLGIADDFAPIGLGTPDISAGGMAIPWGLRFHSPSANVDVEVGALGPNFMVHRVIDNPADVIDAPGIPADAMDTDAAMGLALEAGGAAFLDTFGAENVHIALLGGQPASEEEDVPGALYLTVFSYSPNSDNGDGTVDPSAHLTIVTDMVTGRILLRYADGFDLPPQEDTIALVSSSPSDDDVSVGDVTTVSFTFDQPVDPWAVAEMIEVHPEDAVEYDPGAVTVSDDGMTLSYEVTHLAAETDYVWLSFGGRYFDNLTAAGKTVKPFVVRYSTSATLGINNVSGTVVPAAAGKQNGTTPQVRGDGRFAHRAFEQIKPNVSLSADDLTLLKGTMNLAREEVAAKSTSTAVDAAGAVVVLLDCNVFADGGCDGVDGRNGDVHAATVVQDATGAYTVTGVRDGTYWPAAAQFFNDSGTDPNAATPATLGFYDADGDGQADSINVLGGDVADVTVTLYDAYDLLAFTAEDGQPRADAAAANFADDQVLFGVQGLSMNDGRAIVWQYAYRSTSTSQVTIVEVDPFDENADTIPVDLDGPFFVPGPMPDGYADSDVVVQSGLENGGADFLAGFDHTVTVAAAGAFFDVRDLPLPADVLSGPHWFVVFLGVDQFSDDPDFLITIFDMDGNFVGKISRSDLWAMQQRRERALQVLQAIQGGDVRLVGIVTPKISVDGLSGGWQMAFYIPATDQLAIISLLGDDVTDVEIFENAGLANVTPFDTNIIDSPQALAAALQAGGQDFLDEHPNATIRLAAGYFLKGDVLGFAPYGVIAIIIADEPEPGDDPFPAGKTGDLVPGFTAVIDAATGDVLASEVGEVATAIEDGPEVQTPSTFELQQSYPNPVADRVTIPFDMPKTAQVDIQVFDVLGRRVLNVTEKPFGAGHQEVALDVSNLPNGEYFYQVRMGKEKQTRIMTVIR